MRKVRQYGHIKWLGHELFVTTVLSGEYIAFKPLEEDRWTLYFMSTPLALFDARHLRLNPIARKKK